jgi:hypothetical protein
MGAQNETLLVSWIPHKKGSSGLRVPVGVLWTGSTRWPAFRGMGCLTRPRRARPGRRHRARGGTGYLVRCRATGWQNDNDGLGNPSHCCLCVLSALCGENLKDCGLVGKTNGLGASWRAQSKRRHAAALQNLRIRKAGCPLCVAGVHRLPACATPSSYTAYNLQPHCPANWP